MAYEITDHMEPFRFGVTLHRRRNRIQIVAGLSLGDPEFQAFLGNIGKMLGLLRNFTAEGGAGGVAIETLVVHAHVEADDVPFFKDDILGGEAVNHGFVDRAADSERIPGIAEEVGLHAHVLAHLSGKLVEKYGGNAGTHIRHQFVKNGGRHSVGHAHEFDLMLVLDKNAPKLFHAF